MVDLHMKMNLIIVVYSKPTSNQMHKGLKVKQKHCNAQNDIIKHLYKDQTLN